MRKFIKRFLSIILMALCVTTASVPMCHATEDSDNNIIENITNWATDAGREALVGNIKQDITGFQSEYDREYIETGVPIEAKLGIVLIQALSYIAGVLNDSLLRFAIIFMITAFVFWVMFQAYKLITDDKVKARPTVETLLRRGAILGIWLIVLGFGLPRLFGMIMGPIISVGSYISNLILDSVAANGGYALSDTCAAVREYAAVHMTDTSIIDTKFAADIICLPARMSGFYYGSIKFGWEILISSLGHSAFSFIIGLVLVCVFTYATFKFMITAFGVIADLFLVVILLPFTAIEATVNQTDYTGIAGKIYNGVLGLFNSKSFSLSSQVEKFINAAIYFISLSIAVAIGGALLAHGLSFDPITHIVSIVNGDRITMLLIGALVAYIATHIDDIAKLIGGGIEYTLGTELSKDVQTLYKDTKKKIQEIIKASKK